MNRKKMRDAIFASSWTSIDAHAQTKIDTFLHKMALCEAFTIRFTLTFWSPGVENVAGACLGLFRIASVHKISSWY